MLSSSAFTWFGVIEGRWLITRAAAPETTAAACEVPLPLKKRPSTAAVGWSKSAVPPGTRRLLIDCPGATRSTVRPVAGQLE